MPLPVFTLARHGQTEWSRSGQHTGKTDLPLLPEGEQAAAKLGERLRGFEGTVYTSPLKRASHTASLAGFADAIVDADLVEWDYGDYEGLTSDQIEEKRPDWDLFRDGCPNGESVDQVIARVDRVIAKLKKADGNVLLFSSGHVLRALTARWLQQDITLGSALQLATGTISELGFYHDRSRPCLRIWNDGSHLSG